MHLQSQKLKGHGNLQHCKNHMYKTNKQNISFLISCTPWTSFTYHSCPWRQSLEERFSAQRTRGFVARREPFILWNERKWKQPVSEEREAYENIQGYRFSWFWNIRRNGVINGDGLRTSMRRGNDSISRALVTFYRVLNLWYDRDAVTVLHFKNKIESIYFLNTVEYPVWLEICKSDYRSKMGFMLTSDILDSDVNWKFVKQH